eukprot:3710211-Rhodomonas_salina.1
MAFLGFSVLEAVSGFKLLSVDSARMPVDSSCSMISRRSAGGEAQDGGEGGEEREEERRKRSAGRFPSSS